MSLLDERELLVRSVLRQERAWIVCALVARAIGLTILLAALSWLISDFSGKWIVRFWSNPLRSLHQLQSSVVSDLEFGHLLVFTLGLTALVCAWLLELRAFGWWIGVAGRKHPGSRKMLTAAVLASRHWQRWAVMLRLVCLALFLGACVVALLWENWAWGRVATFQVQAAKGLATAQQVSEAQWVLAIGRDVFACALLLALACWVSTWLLACLAMFPTANAVRRFTGEACKQCGYSLRGNTSGVCSECGTPVPEESAGLA